MEEPSLKIKHWWQNSENIYFKETGSSEVFILANMLSTFCMEKKKQVHKQNLEVYCNVFFSVPEIYISDSILHSKCDVPFATLWKMYSTSLDVSDPYQEMQIIIWCWDDLFLWGAKKYILRRLSLEFSLLLLNPAFYSLCISVWPCPAIILKSFCGEYRNYCSMEKSKYVDVSMQGINTLKGART